MSSYAKGRMMFEYFVMKCNVWTRPSSPEHRLAGMIMETWLQIFKQYWDYETTLHCENKRRCNTTYIPTKLISIYNMIFSNSSNFIKVSKDLSIPFEKVDLLSWRVFWERVDQHCKCTKFYGSAFDALKISTPLGPRISTLLLPSV